MSRNRCPQCKNAVLQKSEQGTRVRIRGPVVFVGDRCLAQCYWCRSSIELPMSLEKGAGETFVINQSVGDRHGSNR